MTNHTKQTVAISLVTIYRTVILGMLSVILWGGNEAYQDFKEDYKHTKDRVAKVEKDIVQLKAKTGVVSIERAMASE